MWSILARSSITAGDKYTLIDDADTLECGSTSSGSVASPGFSRGDLLTETWNEVNESHLLLQGKEDGHPPIECSNANASFGYLRWEEADSNTQLRALDDGTPTTQQRLQYNNTFQVGCRYAIMGETWAGKSMLLRDLAGLLRLIDGSIPLDSKMIDTSSIQWRRDCIGVVSQETVRSLRVNLTHSLLDNPNYDILLAA